MQGWITYWSTELLLPDLPPIICNFHAHIHHQHQGPGPLQTARIFVKHPVGIKIASAQTNNISEDQEREGGTQLQRWPGQFL
jgi:hypothetical protein